MPESNAEVFGILWQLTPTDEAELDVREGVRFGTYRKEIMEVQVEKSDAQLALIYVARDDAVGTPRSGYQEKIVAAAEREGFPPDYVAELRMWLRADV